MFADGYSGWEGNFFFEENALFDTLWDFSLRFFWSLIAVSPQLEALQPPLPWPVPAHVPHDDPYQ